MGQDPLDRRLGPASVFDLNSRSTSHCIRRKPRRNQLPWLFILAAALAFAVSATPSPAQTWPQRPVKFLVTLGPGSGIDIGTRLLADGLSKRWGQPVVVENRPGGDGLVPLTPLVPAP